MRNTAVRIVTVKLPPALDRRLTELSAKRRVSRSEILREALSRLALAGGESATALAGELVGSLSGPADLSSNPEHMRGYGGSVAPGGRARPRRGRR
ncbi:MAG: ribbon-helix-helix protein, CopG family [Deltaproteobacteria bacterium]|nr:ribbon-helix-helix protein, CopG family [Deltaproteobacteria bacterium]